MITTAEQPEHDNDYQRVASAITFIAGRVDRQPTLPEVAEHLHLSPFHAQRLFSRWAGVSPKRFLQVLTVERAKGLLNESRSLLDVAHDVGLSSGSRLYDHFVQLEAVTPGEFKSRGRGLLVEFGVHDTPFGEAFIATTPRGVSHLAFLDGDDPSRSVDALVTQWPEAQVVEHERRTGRIMASMFAPQRSTAPPHHLHVAGTNFQVRVWRALLTVPPGQVTTYSRVATSIGSPNGARAVGRAVGSNPVAWLIPCHRVIREGGDLGGYRWGVTRKLAINAWEEARSADPVGRVAQLTTAEVASR